MKSLIIKDEELHMQVKLLSVRSKKNMIELVEEALKDLLEKYHERDNTRE